MVRLGIKEDINVEQMKEKITMLEANREIIKRKLVKLFDKVRFLDKTLLTCESKQVAFEVEIGKMQHKIDSILGRLIKVENDIEWLKEQSHVHKIVK